MAAVVPQASVARAPAHSQATGIRPHAGADQAGSPFSDLLETDEAPETGAPESASPQPEDPGAPVLPAEGKVVPPHGPPETPPGKDVAKGQSELVLSIVLPPGHAADAETPVVRTKLGATLSQAISNRPKPDSETDVPQLPAQPDADAADVTALAQPVPLPVVVPVPGPVPAAPEAALPVASDVVTAAPAITAAGTVTPESAPEAPPQIVEAKAPAASAPGPAPDTTAEAPTAEVAAAPNARAAEPKAPVAQGSKEKKAPPAEKMAHVTTQTAAEDKKTTTVAAKPASDPQAWSDPEVSPQGDGVSAPKTPDHSTDAAAIVRAAHGDVETPDAKPPAPEAAANSTALPPPPTNHVAAQHAAQPSNQRPLADLVPVDGLAVAIAAHAQSGKNHFEIRLDPPELGRIDVRLNVDKDGQVTSHLRVERPETLDLLRRDAPALERALQQAGLKTSDNGLQFSLRDHSFSQHNHGNDTPAMARIVVPDENLAPVETQRHYGRHAGLGSGVDIRV